MEAAEISALRKRIRTAKTTIGIEANKLETAMEKFSEAVDKLDNRTQSLPEIIERIETNTTAAQTPLDNANKALARLTRLREELEFDQEQSSLNRCEVPEMKLAPIPIPKFSRKLWEWETFWKPFDHTVHSRNIDNLFKFNYLLDALEGDAEESVKHFEVSESTYQLVIEHLKEKYGDKQALVDQLLKNLQGARARTDSLEDQEALCEQLHSITSQLTLKGEHDDNVFLQKENEGNWSTAALLSAAREHIKTELKINRRVEHSLGGGKMEKTNAGKKKYFSKTEVVPRVAPCFYCNKSGHPAKDCDEVTSREQRVQIMRTQNLCHNCGGKDHWATKCPKGTCRICRQAGHHTSICKELFSSQKARQKPPLREVPQKQGTKLQLPKAKTSKINTVASNDGSKGEMKASDAVFHVSNTTKVLILAGQARILNPTTKALETVYVILDTGADRSFISSSLAERLQLKDVDSSRLSIGNFRRSQAFRKDLRHHGSPHMGCTYVHSNENRYHYKTINKKQTESRGQAVPVRKRYSSLHQPYCREDPARYPSWLRRSFLTPQGWTRSSNNPPIRIESNPLATGISHIWTRRRREQFCEFEKSGVKEFLDPITEQLKQTNAEVWKAFDETIEKKEDGYYVRLPWKKEASGLPDNKSITYRRLQANLSKLRKNPNLLQQYDDTIKSQLELGSSKELLRI
ncbi:hypothetical protein RB195_024524 [Necator americanus]|uniref:CCHC-type domain-containing protein n=1 Tax=Necator americanus TaxID=51031 RepID=A0ABR1ENJ7_NECAM